MKKNVLRVCCFTMGCITTLYSLSIHAKELSANVDVHLSDIIGKKNPYYSGGNNIYPKGAQGLLNKDGTFNKNQLRLSQQVGLRTYRFPGGSEGNLYKWKRAIGPIEKRIDNISGNNRGNQSNEFGSDEFGRLIETTGFDHGMMMVAWGYETPSDAADWVEYMNAKVGENPNGGIDWAKVRATNGHPAPYNITYWEIGNEVYGNWELNWGSYPYQFDAKRGTGNVVIDTGSGVSGTLPFGSADRYVFGGSKYFTDQKAAALSTWKGDKIKTTNKKNQQFYVKFPPVDLSHADKPFTLKIKETSWVRVDDFKKSGVNDQHYTIESVSGRITFGDGIHGKIPPKGYTLSVNYLSGKHPGYIDYYEKMKAVDPNIVVLSAFEKESFYEQMAIAKKPFDGVVKHYYPGGHKKAKGKNPYEESVASGIKINHSIYEHKSWLKEYKNPAVMGNEKLWFTEYGIKNHVNQAAIIHTVINDHSNDVGALLGHSIFLDNNSSMITDSGIIRSKALPITVFSKHSQENFVKTKVTGDENRVNKIVLPPVLATASVNNNKDEFSVVLTNTSAKHHVKTTVNIKDFDMSKTSKCEIWILKSNTNNPVADNTDKNPNTVTLTKHMTLDGMQDKYEITIAPASMYILKLKVNE